MPEITRKEAAIAVLSALLAHKRRGWLDGKAGDGGRSLFAHFKDAPSRSRKSVAAEEADSAALSESEFCHTGPDRRGAAADAPRI